MSAGYASRLKEYPHKGVCGLPEHQDTPRVFHRKMDELVQLINGSNRIVVLTGAGVSTGAGIPDFRGPGGIWTQETKRKPQKKRKRKRDTSTKQESTATATSTSTSMDFGKAKPTLTHRALTYLVEKRRVQYIVTQNVDGLHRRSGLSRRYHCALHGCVFTEKCRDCQAEYFGDQDVGGMSFQPTGRKCRKCNGDLCDTLLDWEDPLPEDDFERSTELCEKADLVLSLGTSLRIEPAGSLPTLANKFVIVNLQVTPKDDQAQLILRARLDDVLNVLMDRLGYSDWQDESLPDVEELWTPLTQINE